MRKKIHKVKVTLTTEVVVSASSETAACTEAEKRVKNALFHGDRGDDTFDDVRTESELV